MKLKAVPYHSKQALRVGDTTDTCIINLGARKGWVVDATFLLPYPRERFQYALYRNLGGPRCLCVGFPEKLVLADLKPRTLQLLASHSTDCAIPTLVAYIGVVRWYSASRD